MAQDVATVIKALGYDKVDVVGYSMGGTIGLRFPLAHPELVSKLVIASAPFAYAGWHDYNQQGMRALNASAAESMKGSPLHESFAAANPISKPTSPSCSTRCNTWGRLRLRGRDPEHQGPHYAGLWRLGRCPHQPRREVLRAPRRRPAGRSLGRLRHELEPPRHPPRRHPLHHDDRAEAGRRGVGVPRGEVKEGVGGGLRLVRSHRS